MKIVYCDPMPDDVILPLSILEWTRDQWFVMDDGNYKESEFRPRYDLAIVTGVKDMLESERETLRTTLPLLVMAQLKE